MSILQVDRVVNATDTGAPAFGYGISVGLQPLKFTGTDTVTIAGGIVTLADYKEYATYNGSTYGVDLSLNLKTQVNNTGVVAPTATTTYYLYLKRDSAGAPAATPLNRSVRPCQTGTSGPFIILATTPENIDQSNYVPLALVRTNGSSEYTQFQTINMLMPAAALVAFRYGGYTKIVGNGGYASITAATPTAGDSILVAASYSISVGETISASNVHLTFMPNVIITSTAATITPLTITGSQVQVMRPRYTITGATAPAGITLTGNNNEIVGALITLSNGSTLTDAYRINVGALRNFVTGAVFSTSGTVTNTLTDLGTDTDASVRG